MAKSYCPSCLNKSLSIRSNGVVDIVINGKKRDSGRFYYNMGRDELNLQSFEEKCEEFFKWYARFSNIEPIETIQLLAREVYCQNNCFFNPGTKFSVVNILIPAKEVKRVMSTLGAKYHMEVNIKNLE